MTDKAEHVNPKGEPVIASNSATQLAESGESLPNRISAHPLKTGWYAAFGTILAMMSLVSVVAWLLYDSLSTTLDRMVNETLPTVDASRDLSGTVRNLVNSGDVLVAAESPAIIQREEALAKANIEILNRLLLQFDKQSATEFISKRLAPISRQIAERLTQIQDLSTKRLELSEAELADITEILALRRHLQEIATDLNSTVQAQNDPYPDTKLLWESHFILQNQLAIANNVSRLSGVIATESAREEFLKLAAQQFPPSQSTPSDKIAQKLNALAAEIKQFGVGDNSLFQRHINILNYTLQAQGLAQANRRVAAQINLMIATTTKEATAGMEREQHQAINRIKQAKIVMAIVMLLATLIVFVVLRRYINHQIIAPISNLKKAAEAIEAGAHDITVDPSGALEIQDVADTFNRMTRKLHLNELALLDAQATLEARVKERTEDLEREIQERKTVEHNLEDAINVSIKANQAKSQFLSSMSHELRTPLNAILGFTQLIQYGAEEKEDTENQELTFQILKAGNHLLNLINEVLDLSRIETGNLDITIENIYLPDIISESLELTQSMAKKHHVTVIDTISTQQNLPFVSADKVRLKQAIINLMSNAIKYNRPEGEVKLSGYGPDNGRFKICIEDTGIGIANNKIENLFKPFERLGAESLGIEGTGVGLTITKELIERMGGNLHVTSRLGHGSIFTIELLINDNLAKPEIKQETPMERAISFAKDAMSGKSILYAEDNPANQKLMEEILGRIENLTVRIVPTGEGAIALAQTISPDLIILDINLPGISGYEALESLKDDPTTRDIPVIAITASAMPEDIAKGKKAGFRDYLTKPLNIPKVLEVISSLLAEGKPADD